MNSLQNSTKIPVLILMFFGLWDFQISNKKSLNFLYLLYKISIIFSFACIIYGAVNLFINFNFQKEGVEYFFNHMETVLESFIMALIISEGVFVRDEWKIILQEFGEVEIIFEDLNFESQKLSTFKKVLSILPALLVFGSLFLIRIPDLYSAIRLYDYHVVYIANYLRMIWYIVYCWNVKNLYKNLNLYVHEIEKLMAIKKTKICSREISLCLRILNQLSKVNCRANKFFTLKISTVLGKVSSI